MATTRQLIIDYIQEKHAATTGDISQSLRITPANVRHHLSILLDEGVVLIEGYRPVKGRGRPAALYALAQASTQHNLSLLSSTLLNELVTSQPPRRQAEFLQHIAQHIAGEKTDPTPNLTQRIYLAIERLNQMHYQARWEARADAPRLTLGHCPYASIIEQQPILCTLDCYLISVLTGTQAKLIERLAPTPQGTRECHFTLQV